MGSIAQQKMDLRQVVRTGRDALAARPEVKNQADAAIVSYVAAYVRGLPHPHPKVAAYSPLPDEPGSGMLLDALTSQAAAIELPISMPDGVLKWARYRGQSDLATGALGIWQPTGPQFNSNVLSSCDAIFVPAMAISKTGARLGKGAGYYDRALAELRGTVPFVALVYHSEFLDEVSTDEHDIPVDAVITDRGYHEF